MVLMGKRKWILCTSTGFICVVILKSKLLLKFKEKWFENIFSKTKIRDTDLCICAKFWPRDENIQEKLGFSQTRKNVNV